MVAVSKNPGLFAVFVTISLISGLILLLVWFTFDAVRFKSISSTCQVEKKEEVLSQCCEVDLRSKCKCVSCIPDCEKIASSNINQTEIFCCTSKSSSCCVDSEVQKVYCKLWIETEMCNVKCGTCLNATLLLIAPTFHTSDIVYYSCGRNDHICMDRQRLLYAEQSMVTCYLHENHIFLEPLLNEKAFWGWFSLVFLLGTYFALATVVLQKYYKQDDYEQIP